MTLSICLSIIEKVEARVKIKTTYHRYLEDRLKEESGIRLFLFLVSWFFLVCTNVSRIKLTEVTGDAL